MKRYLIISAMLLAGALVGAAAMAQAGPNDPPVNVGGTRCNPKGDLSRGLDAGVGPAMSGLWHSQWCRDVNGKWWLQIGVVATSDAASFAAMAHDWMLAINGSNYDMAMGAWREKYAAQTGDPYAPKFKPIWYASLPAIMASKPADEVVTPPPAPAPKVCTVAANGTAKTRQWYPFAAGARTSTTGGGSVTIAATACKLDVASVVEGSTQYGAFGPTFRADRVTVCTCQ